MDSNEVQKLAETLKKQGLAVSMTEALEKARNILGATASGQEMPFSQEHDQENIINSDKSLNELLAEAGVNTQDLEQRQKALMESEISQIKDDLKEIKRDIKKPDVPSQKVLDKMHDVVEEIEAFAEMKRDLLEKEERASGDEKKPNP